MDEGITVRAPAGAPDPVDVAAATRELVAGMALRPWGEASPSTYETGRLVSLAPWLTGHAERVAYLLAGQRPDGGWGVAGGYDLVPTLSATEALLSTVDRPPVAREAVLSAVDAGLDALRARLAIRGETSTPDMPAVELIVPSLVRRINDRLDQPAGQPGDGPDGWRRRGRLPLPEGMDDRRLEAVRSRLARGLAVPEKVLHALEVVDDVARGAAGVRLASSGAVGASPAATAAWLGPAGAAADDHAARAHAYLREVVTRQGGPVPCATPITVFERAWVLGVLARLGTSLAVPGFLLRELEAALGPGGAAAAPGLPRDADTTAMTVYALGELGRPVDPGSLLAFRADAHFCTWPGEDGFSVTTNAHVLDAIGGHLERGGPDPRFRDRVEPLADWLAGHQRSDGLWQDRWHASPYYATACCALTLDRYGRGGAAAAAVRRAVRGVRESQRPDGSWGRWTGTVEETAYALQILLGTGGPVDVGTAEAADRGRRFLLSRTDREQDPPLWHDKDLYRPGAIVRAATLAALDLAQRRLSVTKNGKLVVSQ